MAGNAAPGAYGPITFEVAVERCASEIAHSSRRAYALASGQLAAFWRAQERQAARFFCLLSYPQSVDIEAFICVVRQDDPTIGLPRRTWEPST